MSQNNSSDNNKNNKTFFAPAERSSQDEIWAQSAIALRNPLVRCALDVFADNTMILNENRQVIAYNEQLVQSLKIDDGRKLMGKRYGEILQCVNVKDGPSGCGTSKACRSCFAVITILASQQLKNEKSGYCNFTTESDGVRSSRLFYIKCFPIDTENFTPLIFTMKELDEEDIKTIDRDHLFMDPSNLQ